MIRRVVTAKTATGRSVISHDEELPDVAYRHTPGFANTLVWTTGAPPEAKADVTATLRTGDIIVQNAARHAWRVPSDRPATVFFVLMGQAR